MGIRMYISYVIVVAATVLLLGSVCTSASGSPAGDMAYQQAWIGKASVLFAVCILLALLIGLWKNKKKKSFDFYRIVIWTLILWGGIEAVWGLCQVYGFSYSNHSLYALTGSFFNPGPYSGYLAMVFPLCLNEWLKLKKQSNKSWIQRIGFCSSGSVALLIICVLPAGMSRSAWLATAISGLWICGIHYGVGKTLKQLWSQHRKWTVSISIVGIICLLVGMAALFQLKKDSANGRLFMWKINSLAIAEKPMIGYGHGNFAQAYGAAQEAYFAKGDYSAQEELVAGSPEYAFNEYQQIAIEWGIPMLCFLLLVIVFCLWRGIRENRISACGGIVSLLLFSFSSYPMQLPVFVLTFFFLLAACVIGHSWIRLGVFALAVGAIGGWLWKTDTSGECKKWVNMEMYHNIRAYETAKKGYQSLYPILRDRGTFLFEYGYCLHKLNEYEASITILKEAATRSCDPMILNIIGKNYQELKQEKLAEEYFIRSVHRLPSRIYPYYLLAKFYAACNMPNKTKEMAEIVLTKEPKVQSTAVKEMREEMRKLLVASENEDEAKKE